MPRRLKRHGACHGPSHLRPPVRQPRLARAERHSNTEGARLDAEVKASAVEVPAAERAETPEVVLGRPAHPTVQTGSNHMPRRGSAGRSSRVTSADGHRAWRQRSLPIKRAADRAWSYCCPPSVARKARRRSAADTTGSIGCVASSASVRQSTTRAPRRPTAHRIRAGARVRKVWRATMASPPSRSTSLMRPRSFDAGRA